MRTELTVQDIVQSGLNPAYVAADATNDMMFKNDGKTFLHVKNAGAGAVNVTIVSVPDVFGRSGDVVVNISAGAERMIGVFKDFLFNQKSGADVNKIYVNFDVDASVTVAAIKI